MSDDLKTITLDSTSKNVPEYVAGTNVTITPDSQDSNKRIISATGGGSTLQYTEDAPDIPNQTNNVVQNDVIGNTADGGYALAEGYSTTARGSSSHAEGYGTIAGGTYTHAEGFRTTAGGHSSHAEGFRTVTSNTHAHAEGRSTTASGAFSHAEGDNTTASNDCAHAEGFYTVASGMFSHAGGDGTIAQRRTQTAIGKYNVADTVGADKTELGKYAFIIGNGDDDVDRSNAFTVDWNGQIAMNDVPMVDYVISDTTSGNWKVRKWNSGKVEMWYKATNQSLTIATQVGSLYQTASNVNVAYPETLGNVQFVNVSVLQSNYSVWSVLYGSTNSQVSFRCFSASSRAQATTYTIEVYVVGEVASS